ncbi:Uncharacterised protein [Mycobacteroides abscessus subsp. abscessus]|nr:Uncharacterised protein [Mycobacteroides abscessus subsp. abscessus]
MTASGMTPYERHSRVSANCRPVRTGWMRLIPTTGSPARTTSTSEKPTCATKSGSMSARAAANSGSESSSVRAIPAHCDPCPEYTKTVPGLQRPP